MTSGGICKERSTYGMDAIPTISQNGSSFAEAAETLDIIPNKQTNKQTLKT
jgi:hypothetical protein